MANKLVLGNVVFQGFEIPERLEGIGGVQKLSVFNYVGPKKGVQALGPKPNDITWHGNFVYTNSADRIKLIDQYRISGEVVRLAWGEFAYQVVVKSFKVTAHHENEYEYEIQLEVVEDLTGVPVKPKGSTSDEGIGNAISYANKALDNLQSNPNFTPTSLPGGVALPEDSQTTIAYLVDPIDIQPTDTVQTTGALG